MKVKIELERADFDALHDVIIEALDLETEVTDEQIQKVWDRVSEFTQGQGIHLGCNDTVFSDNLYDELQGDKEVFISLLGFDKITN
jgi:hypothetical protein